MNGSLVVLIPDTGANMVRTRDMRPEMPPDMLQAKAFFDDVLMADASGVIEAMPCVSCGQSQHLDDGSPRRCPLCNMWKHAACEEQALISDREQADEDDAPLLPVTLRTALLHEFEGCDQKLQQSLDSLRPPCQALYSFRDAMCSWCGVVVDSLVVDSEAVDLG